MYGTSVLGITIGAGGALAFTGGPLGWLVAVALLLVVGGLLLVRWMRVRAPR